MTTTQLLREVAGQITIPLDYLNDNRAGWMFVVAEALVQRLNDDASAEPELFYFMSTNLHASEIVNTLNMFVKLGSASYTRTFTSGISSEFTHRMEISNSGTSDEPAILIRWSITYTGPDLPSTARISFRM